MGATRCGTSLTQTRPVAARAAAMGGKRKATSVTSILVPLDKKQLPKEETGGDLNTKDRRRYVRIRQKEQASGMLDSMAEEADTRLKAGSKKKGLVNRVVQERLGDREPRLGQDDVDRVSAGVWNRLRGVVSSSDAKVDHSNWTSKAIAAASVVLPNAVVDSVANTLCGGPATLFETSEFKALADQIDYIHSTGFHLEMADLDKIVIKAVLKKYGSLEHPTVRRFKADKPGFPGKDFWVAFCARTGRSYLTPQDKTSTRIGAATEETLREWCKEFKECVSIA